MGKSKKGKKTFAITITAASFKKMEKAIKALESVGDIEIFHHIRISGRKDFQIMKDVGKNYEKIKKV